MPFAFKPRGKSAQLKMLFRQQYPVSVCSQNISRGKPAQTATGHNHIIIFLKFFNFTEFQYQIPFYDFIYKVSQIIQIKFHKLFNSKLCKLQGGLLKNSKQSWF
eukprot:TRINITY_DN2883_c0_g1_i1.p1 TRINITY_DN2883_c0_g1~~TRINITY_DN2883_c0_g1_i1.p1  ORF type:complete len:104 (+),score=3.29 TRINITY_DN2883_c0_g1_i1:240-551(+)